MQALQQRVIVNQNDFEKQKLGLARAIGLPVGQPFTLADQVAYTPPPHWEWNRPFSRLSRTAPNYRGAAAFVSAAESAKRAAMDERLPGLQFDANYGSTGFQPWQSHGTFAAGVTLAIPVFQAAAPRPTSSRRIPCSNNARRNWLTCATASSRKSASRCWT